MVLLKEKDASIIGQKYGRLTIQNVFRKDGRGWVDVICECGNKKTLYINHVKSGATKSCGCITRDGLIRTHGLSKHPLYFVWIDIKQRCLYPGHARYNDYGGRGITICKEWKTDFMSFYNWCINNGYRKGLSVDRFPSNDGDYSPSNCRLATMTQQQRNKRDNHLLEFNGKRLTIIEWSEATGIKRGSIHNRLRLGWPIEKILTQCEKTLKRKKSSL